MKKSTPTDYIIAIGFALGWSTLITVHLIGIAIYGEVLISEPNMVLLYFEIIVCSILVLYFGNLIRRERKHGEKMEKVY